ncbi:MAG TPA: hotdog fold thioesterase [Propionibacteriaceae bacterium]|nr:hotdog fold thioesterase [Propionibacteriaceae bacterium]
MTNELPDWAVTMDSALETRLGVVLERVSPEETRGRMPVEGNTQIAGILHGGATCALAEGLGSIAAYAYGRDRGLVPVGVDINATHHRSARSGWVTGVARPLYLGSRTVTYEIVVSDEEGHRLTTARITCQLRRSTLPG